MKRKIIAALLTAALTAGAFTGCGNRVEGDGRAWAAMADAGEGRDGNIGSPESGAPKSENGVMAEPETKTGPTVQPEAQKGPAAEPKGQPTRG